jgi:pimeloyl-ACP methyl ester carboxylesterase
MTGAVVCLHGLGRTPNDWERVRAVLGRFGDVRAPALPIRQRETVAFLGSMIAPGDIVVGHSMGGVVAQMVGARVPLRALVLTGCFFPPARNGRGLGQSLADYAGHRVAYVRAAAAGAWTGRERAPGSMRALAPLVRQALGSRADDPFPPLPGTPTLVVHARDDHHVPIDFALAAVAAHPGWSRAILAHGGHHVHVDLPTNWLAAVAPWLGSTLGF